MVKSALQTARYAYSPKLPLILRENISEIVPVLGEKTASQTDQKALAELFPNTYGLPKVTLEKEPTKMCQKK